jgi:hypothetical protein
MTTNFFINNLSPSDRRLRGLTLVRACSPSMPCAPLGAVANVGLPGYVVSRNEVGSVWSHAASSAFTWKQKITCK